MFSLIKSIIFIVGFAVVSLFVLRHFGYDVNMHYFNESKAACQQRLDECSKQLLENGTKGAKCDYKCVDPTLIIKKQ